jgi:hypothetical protein
LPQLHPEAPVVLQLLHPLQPPEQHEHPPPFNSLLNCLRALLPLKNIRIASTMMTIPFPIIDAITAPPFYSLKLKP